MSSSRLAGSRVVAYPWVVRVDLMGLGLLTSGALLAGCSGTAAPYTSDAEQGSTHALITVERRDVLGSEQASQGKAFASFVRTPPDVDAAVVTRIAGLNLEIPEASSCALAGSAKETSLALSPLRRVQLLDAGDVSLETTTGRVELAPRAFPAVTDQVAGVVYSTRDRAARLPSGEAYALSVAGSASLGALAVSMVAPEALSGLALSGVPLEDPAVELGRAGAVLTWQAGSARDLVYVTLGGADGAPHATCTFYDEAGSGSLPPSAIPPSATAVLSLHRLRIVALTGSGANAIDAGELRFDFELVTSVGIVAR